MNIWVDGVMVRGFHCAECTDPVIARKWQHFAKKNNGKPLCEPCGEAHKPIKACRRCEKKYWQGVGWGFCSDECRDDARKPLHIGTCACGANLHKRTKECSRCRTGSWPRCAVYWCVDCGIAFGSKSKAKACDACRPAFRLRAKRAKDTRRNNREQAARLALLRCEHCNGAVSGKRQKYCSDECSAEARSTTGKKPKQWFACEFCKNPYLAYNKRASCGEGRCATLEQLPRQRRWKDRQRTFARYCKECGVLVGVFPRTPDGKLPIRRVCEAHKKKEKRGVFAARTPESAARRRARDARSDARKQGVPAELAVVIGAISALRGAGRDIKNGRTYDGSRVEGALGRGDQGSVCREDAVEAVLRDRGSGKGEDSARATAPTRSNAKV